MTPSPVLKNIPGPKADEPKEKKPRIRHTEAQLAALNDLYDENEHPSLDERAALANNLGMDTKAVNAWFANKRSATKKKTKGTVALVASPPPSVGNPDLADDDEEEEWSRPLYFLSTPPPDMGRHRSYHLESSTMDPFENKHIFEGELPGIPGRVRQRPSARQTEELRGLYNINSHPSREDREELGDKIGMRYQSVTNWFQNQRSIAKKRREDEAMHPRVQHKQSRHIDSSPEPRAYMAFPPASHHPSLAVSATSNSLHSDTLRLDRELSIDLKPSDANVRRLRNNGHIPRPRRMRPEPYQLAALRTLFTRTSNPSIEERGALALEIGMDVGKVTNWFRNLRQTARKRAQKTNSDDVDDDGMDFESAPVSRMGTPSPISSSSSSVDGDAEAEHMDLDGEDGRQAQSHSDLGSEEDYQEAVTPSPVTSPLPLPASRSSSRRMNVEFLAGPTATHDISDNYTKGLPAVRVEDALLLLSFSRHISQCTA